MRLRVESISYEVNKRHLLRDISFSLRDGEMVAILGANGAGKSTLMSILSGEKNPETGRVILDGTELSKYSKKELAGKRAMLKQQNTLSLAFSVEEVVMMGRYGQYGRNPVSKDQLAVKETMEICGLGHLAERSMLTLSGGEQQRVHLARVLAQIWDSKNALLLLDEPVSSMDMQYQHQTLAIAAALAKKGFTVVTVLHDINLAAQYASHIIMLKGGRKWWDGTPAQVLTSTHIFSAFAIHARVHTDLKSLRVQVQPQEITLDASSFNSNLSIDCEGVSLREKFHNYRKNNPGKGIHEIAKALNSSEAHLMMTGLGENVTLLRPEIDEILRQVEKLGAVRAFTRNNHCIHERNGVYSNFSITPQAALFLGEDIDLRLFLSQWKLALSIVENGLYSLQFFNGNGEAVHKIYLTDESNKKAYEELVSGFSASEQVTVELVVDHKPERPERRDAEIDIEGFHDAWNSMTDSHEFFGLLHRFGLTRMQALRLAPDGRTMQLSLEMFKKTLINCSLNQVPLMVFTGNKGCIQIHTGEVGTLKPEGAWLRISADQFNLLLNEDGVSSVWHVVKPSTDGEVNSIELYDNQGEQIVQFFGKRKPGVPELEEWREALSGSLI